MTPGEVPGDFYGEKLGNFPRRSWGKIKILSLRNFRRV